MAKRLIPPADLPSVGITIGNDTRKDLEAEGKFPRRVWVTERTHAYVEDEIFAYIEARIAERDAVTA
jgi:predicted DNA-binding transcriptional regulator AlpA